ncbi:MAG: hypothetical protein ACK4ND_16330 [Cytophagaceae bacterium]
MNFEPLTEDDKKLLRSELRQTALAVLFPASIIAGIGGVFVFFYQDVWMAVLVLCTYCLLVVAIFLLITNRMRKDYFSGEKRVIKGKVTDKKSSTNYGWHASIGADMVSQPRLVEYYLFIDHKPFNVHKEVYNNFENGSAVKLSFTINRNKLIGVKGGNDGSDDKLHA